MSDDTDNIISALAGWLRQAGSVAVLTGAGVSAESGVPTFRDAGGLWEGHRVEDVATPEGFARVRRYRQDKEPDGADTIGAVRALLHDPVSRETGRPGPPPAR